MVEGELVVGGGERTIIEWTSKSGMKTGTELKGLVGLEVGDSDLMGEAIFVELIMSFKTKLERKLSEKSWVRLKLEIEFVGAGGRDEVVGSFAGKAVLGAGVGFILIGKRIVFKATGMRKKEGGRVTPDFRVSAPDNVIAVSVDEGDNFGTVGFGGEGKVGVSDGGVVGHII